MKKHRHPPGVFFIDDEGNGKEKGWTKPLIPYIMDELEDSWLVVFAAMAISVISIVVLVVIFTLHYVDKEAVVGTGGKRTTAYIASGVLGAMGLIQLFMLSRQVPEHRSKTDKRLCAASFVAGAVGGIATFIVFR